MKVTPPLAVARWHPLRRRITRDMKWDPNNNGIVFNPLRALAQNKHDVSTLLRAVAVAADATATAVNSARSTAACSGFSKGRKRVQDMLF